MRLLDADNEKRVQVILRDGTPAEPFMVRAAFEEDKFVFNAVTLGSGKVPLVSDAEVLEVLGNTGWATITDVADTLNQPPDTVSRRLHALARLRKIRSKPDPGDITHRRVLYSAKEEPQDDPNF